FAVSIWSTTKAKTSTMLVPWFVSPVLAIVLNAPVVVQDFFYQDPSGKAIANELAARGIPSDHVSVAQMHRGQRYSLSFYLKNEIPECDTKYPHEGYILVGSRRCPIGESAIFSCKETPFGLSKTGFFLYQVRRKSVGAGGSGEVQ